MTIKGPTVADAKPDCMICGQPYHRHVEICGVGRVCPVSAVTYRAPATRTATNRTSEGEAEAVEDFLREIYGHAFKEGAESTIEQWHAERSGRTERWPEAPAMPHRDCENEGAYQFIEDTKPKLLALLPELPAKPDPEATRTELPLVNAVRSFESADTEYRRAKNIGEQPRLNRAGTRYYVAKSRVFKALHGLARKQAGEGS